MKPVHKITITPTFLKALIQNERVNVQGKAQDWSIQLSDDFTFENLVSIIDEVILFKKAKHHQEAEAIYCQITEMIRDAISTDASELVAGDRQLTDFPGWTVDLVVKRRV